MDRSRFERSTHLATRVSRSAAFKIVLTSGLLAEIAIGSYAMQAKRPPDAAAPIQASSQLDVTPESRADRTTGQPTYQADNPKNKLHLVFGASGVHLSPSAAAFPVWSLDLALAAVGFDDQVTAPGPALLSASGTRVNYDFEAVRQWYVNTDSDLEQGFRVSEPPSDQRRQGTTTITLDLSVDGDLKPTHVQPSYFIDFVAPNGETVLRYGALRATDANGALLPARLEVRAAVPGGGSPGIRITVDVADQAYPITLAAAVSPVAPGGPKSETSAEGVSGEMVGVPVTLEPGIRESVQEIMARGKSAPPPVPTRPRETHHEFDADLELLEDPNAAAASHWPPMDSSVSTPESTSKASGSPDLPQTVGTSFKAVGVVESGFIPPDSMGDVGPTQILVHVNGRIRTFTKAGVADGALDTDDVTFWTSVTGSGGISDPEVRYDRLSGRWFVLAITVAEATNNLIVIAVSSGPTITDQTSFTFYSFPIGTPSPADATSFCDYPSLGVDANALYTGCNMFSSAGAFRWTSAFVIRKSSVLSGGPMVVTGFNNITGGCGVTTACTNNPCNFNAGPYAPRGVDNDDPQATEGYIVGTDLCFLSRLEFRRVSNPGGTPTLSSNIALTTLSTTNMSTQQASGSTTNVDPSDSRLFMASIHKNKLSGVSSLWTALSLETTTLCVGSGSGNTRRIGARWHEIGNLAATPTLTQSGTLCTTTTGAMSLNSQRGFLYPSVVETGQGHMALGASFASASEFIGVAAAGRLRTDPSAGTRAPESIVLNGSASYTITDPSGRNRWGDYSITRVDPNDDQTVWTFQEYADAPANRWSVRVVQLLAPPPPALATATPVCAGLAATTSTITATDNCPAPSCSNGLCTGGGTCPEFFDPGADTGGPGYATHLTATVTGGVTVNPFPATNIVIPGSPSTSRVLQATLSLNTTAATAGAQNVTLTNPDGQTTTGTAILMVNPSPAAPTASNSGPICAGSTLQLNASTVAGATYSWTGPNGFTSSLQNPSIANATAAATGTYSVTVTVSGCSSSAGTTSATVTAVGQSCNDNNLCTTSDVCQAGGACAGTPVVCTPLDSCHNAGTCDTGTGLCSNPPKPDGSTCSDGNACTQTDTCQGGACTGANPVVCTPSDSCHDAGTCDTGTGLCSNPPKPDGSTCSDGNACTQTDTCQSGACSGANPVVCSASDQCHDAGTCNSGTGLCSNPPKPDGTTCEDGNPCTASDICQAGACQAGPPADLDHDSHVSGVCGGDDCNDGNPLVWFSPIEVANLTVDATGSTTLTWDDQGALTGPEGTYDLVSGGDFLVAGSFGFATSTCLQSAGPTGYTDSRPDPAPGSAFWYLARARNSCGVGTYGTALRDSSIPPCP